MSMYGLDIIINRDGKRFLNEINGILSGMRGFREIYGDNRVEEKVYDMLQTKYGNLTVNDGTYGINQFKKEHPFIHPLCHFIIKTTILRRISSFLNSDLDSTISSKKAETDWLTDRADNSNEVEFPFESYDGQESTVINHINEELPHPMVNPIVAEDISGNKFLQYLLLNNSEIAETQIKSSLVGLGATNEEELKKLVANYDTFVVKPVLGYCGKGIKFLSQEEVVEKYKNSRGPVDYVSPLRSILTIDRKLFRIKYIEDLIEEGDFSFESGVSIIQPFIDSKKGNYEGSTYSVIRAIVCNGKFVDAYQRVSSNPRVNLSQDATPVSFDYDDEFARFCEKTIEVFESRAGEYDFDSYKKILYQKYIDARGKTSDDQREFDRISPLRNVIFDVR